MTRGRLLLSTVIFALLAPVVSSLLDDRSWTSRIIGGLVGGIVWFFLMAVVFRVHLRGTQSDRPAD